MFPKTVHTQISSSELDFWPWDASHLKKEKKGSSLHIATVMTALNGHFRGHFAFAWHWGQSNGHSICRLDQSALTESDPAETWRLCDVLLLNLRSVGSLALLLETYLCIALPQLVLWPTNCTDPYISYAFPFLCLSRAPIWPVLNMALRMNEQGHFPTNNLNYRIAEQNKLLFPLDSLPLLLPNPLCTSILPKTSLPFNFSLSLYVYIYIYWKAFVLTLPSSKSYEAVPRNVSM